MRASDRARALSGTGFRGLIGCAGLPLPLRLLGALLLVLAANAWATGYVSAERFVYAWDWAAYWLQYQELGALLRSDGMAGLSEIRRSIAVSEYTPVPVLPLMPFELVFGPGRLAYILAITNAALLPAAFLIAWLVERAMGRRSWARYLLCTAGVLALHILWAPVLRGLPDVLGVVIACAILLAWFGDRAPERCTLARLAGIGLLLCLLVLTRRYYLFWVVAFFPAALAAWFADRPRAERGAHGLVAIVRALAVVGAASLVFLVILAAPLVRRLVANDYAGAYAAYRAELVGAGTLGQIVDHFGIALLVLCIGGLVWLATRRATRGLGTLLIVQALLAFGLFTHVQTLLGVQHYYLLAPAAGVGLAAAIAAIWDTAWHPGWRAAGIAAVLGIVVASSLATFSPSPPGASRLLPRARFAPLVRPDLDALRRLLAALTALKPDHVYVAASSQLFNSGILAMGCRDMQPALCPHIAVTQDIDRRDGFPRGMLDADYVVLATPTQYHVRPEDQRVVGLVARDIRAGRSLGQSFMRLPGSFTLAQGIRVDIYRRVAPLRPEAIAALGVELAHAYPDMRAVFEHPEMEPMR